MIDGINRVIQPIWRPKTKYVIQVKVKDQLSGADNSTYTSYHNYAFSTEGPLGHFHIPRLNDDGYLGDAYYNNLSDEYKDEYVLADLRSYVDFTKSYPNADGNLLSAKPLFYEHPKLSLFFTKPYVHTMFNDYDGYGNLNPLESQLKAVIRDPADQPTSVTHGTKNVRASWRAIDEGIVEQDVQMINNLIINGEPCVETIRMTPPSVAADLVPDTLKPKKTYTAIINSEFERTASEVLRYTFQTSRYPDFKTQVESYILSAEFGKKAIYNFQIDTVDTVLCKKVVEDTLPQTDVLRRDFADQFDRLMYVMGIGALETPMNTEFNVIHDDNQSFGILVRSPEPFNDPKIPVQEIINQLRLSHTGIPDNAYRVVISKDGASLFITTDGLDLDDGDIAITLPYLEFDGQQYVVSSSLAHQAPAVIVRLGGY